MADNVVAKVFRFDPTVDEEPRYETYEVPAKENQTALEVLHYINENIEPLNYDYCCRGGLCGRCSMTIDGAPSLACFTPMAEGKHTIDPLEGFPVVRDLVTDKNEVRTKIIDTRVELYTVDPLDINAMPEIDHDVYWNELDTVNMCRECMCCYSSCMAFNSKDLHESYAGPAALAHIAQRFLDPEDQGDRVLQAVTAGLYDCMDCGMCDQVCPASIPHLDLYAKLREEAEVRGLKPKSAE